MSYERAPLVLRELDRWVVWANVGDRTKVPLQPDGGSASVTEPTTWVTFDAAASRADRFGGIGFVLGEPFCGIDLDGCRDPGSGDVAPWARRWILEFDSYSEVSPSRTGVKIFCRGKLPFESGKKQSVDEPAMGGKSPAVEIYDHARYFAVTGLRLHGVSVDVEERQDVIDRFCAAMFRAGVSRREADSELGVLERAARYLQRIPPAVSGSGGHNQTFHAACVLVLGFGLSVREAYGLLWNWNQHCTPPWSQKELTHKLESAATQPGPRNYLRDARQSAWDVVKVPVYVEPRVELAQGVVTTQDAARKYLDRLGKPESEMLKLGIAELDTALAGGVAQSEMVIIAARPSHGKSMVALQCLDSASRSGQPCVIISEEMSSLALGKRVIQFASDVAEEHWLADRSRVGRELDEHFAKREPVYIAEGCRTSQRACATIKRYVETKGVRVAAVDYAQILSGAGKSRYEQITQTSIELRALANELKIVLIVLCQLNRQIESRDKFIPRSADLRDTGQLEQDADVVVFLVWPHRIDNRIHPRKFQIFVSKNRNRAIVKSAFDCDFWPSKQMILHSKPTAVVSHRAAVFDEWNAGS